MFNWKKKIDDQEETEKRDRERREAEQKARQLAEQKEYQEKQRREMKEKQYEFGQKFHCHIVGCNFTSTGPTEWETTHGPSWDDDHTSHHIDWNLPNDLWQCKNCNKWTCADHIHKGICQTCAEKI